MFDLTAYNTFNLKVKAKQGIVINNVADLRRVYTDKYIVLGHGSDVLFTDDYDGTVLINKIMGISIVPDGTDFLVQVGAGYVLDELIEIFISNGIYGIENLSGIPGTIGAAPIQNIGAYGVEIGDFIESIRVYDMDKRVFEDVSHERCAFGYRTSYFKTHKEKHLFITSITLRLHSEFDPVLTYAGLKKEKISTPQQLRALVKDLRKQKLPDHRYIGNAGSFFKNPVVPESKKNSLLARYPDMPFYSTEEEGQFKLAAGWLIDKAGCRGITHGNAGTWEKQALVIVNRGGAIPNEIVALAKYIQMEVVRNFDLLLEPEVRVFGRGGEISWDQV
ncbi:MAG TPA: UDP-N-acetylmuramate dehydrogenase [Succinivibrionaceae bacterium]|nr:UDP-N-acetylmuramate dehydrogenase [Succinivibrionaceae bacterium]